MAKKPQAEPAAPAPGEATQIGVYRDKKTGEVTDLVLPNPEPKTMAEVAENYFVEHDQYTANEVVVAPDFTVFPGSDKGFNSAENHCRANGLGAPMRIARK